MPGQDLVQLPALVRRGDGHVGLAKPRQFFRMGLARLRGLFFLLFFLFIFLFLFIGFFIFITIGFRFS